MGRFHRDFFPREFNCATMREWTISSGGWSCRECRRRHGQSRPTGRRPAARGPAQVTASITANNNLAIQTGTTRLTVWLAPGMFDFKRPISIVVNGHKMNNHASVIAQSGNPLGKRPHPRRPPAPVLGEIRLSHRAGEHRQVARDAQPRGAVPGLSKPAGRYFSAFGSMKPSMNQPSGSLLAPMPPNPSVGATTL